MRIFEVYELWKYETKFSLFFSDTSEAVGKIAAVHAQQTKNQAADILKKRSKFITSVQSIVRSITYEYILNVIAIFQLVELAFRIQFYDHNMQQVYPWMVF